MRPVAVCLFLLLVGGVPRSFADTFYQFNLSNITYVGNDVCGAGGNQPCVETFSASFELDEASPDYGTVVPGTASITSSGPLGTLNCCQAFLPQGFIGIVGGSFASGYTEFDILGFPANALVEMYACTSATCSQDFCNQECSLGPLAPFPICFDCAFAPVSGSITVSEVPEPSTLMLVLAGVCCLFAWGIRLTTSANRRSRRFLSAPRRTDQTSADDGADCGLHLRFAA